MSRNQTHAVELAGGISRGELEPAHLSDADWSLLLLAAGLNDVGAGPIAVARDVLSRFAQKTGYFAEMAQEAAQALWKDVKNVKT